MSLGGAGPRARCAAGGAGEEQGEEAGAIAASPREPDAPRAARPPERVRLKVLTDAAE